MKFLLSFSDSKENYQDIICFGVCAVPCFLRDVPWNQTCEPYTHNMPPRDQEPHHNVRPCDVESRCYGTMWGRHGIDVD